MKISWLLIIFALVFCNLPSISQTNSFNNAEKQLTAWFVTDQDSTYTLTQRMQHYGADALSVAVIKNFLLDTAIAYGIADDSSNTPATINTLFQVGSLSKVIHTTAILCLAQEGKLELEIDINQYLTSWKFPYNPRLANRTINHQQILSHTAGINVHGFYGYLYHQPKPTIVEILQGKKPALNEKVSSFGVPGKEFSYSGGGYCISQLIATDVSGENYAAFIQKRIFDPLNMKHSSYDGYNKQKQYQLAAGHLENGLRIQGGHYYYTELAAAGLWTTPSDFAKFLIETANEFNGKSNLLLNHKLAILRLSPQLKNTEPYTEVLMGGFLLGDSTNSYFTHTGANPGFNSLFYLNLKDGNGIVVVCNRNYCQSLLKEVTCAVANSYKWNQFKLKTCKFTLHKPTNRERRKLNGIYKYEDTTLTLFFKDDKAFANYNNLTYPVFFISPTEFVIREKANQVYEIRKGVKGKRSVVTKIHYEN